MNTLQPPGNNQQKQTNPQNNSFARALLEAGGQVVQSAGTAVAETLSDTMNSLFGAGTSTATQTQQNPNENILNTQNHNNELFNSNERNRLDQEREWKRRERRILRHREVQQTEVFDRRKVETERRIEQLIEQIGLLAKDLDEANAEARQAQIAVIQAATGAGDYYVNFFERMLKIVVMLRKSVQESASWLEMFNSRKSAQKGYWGSFYGQGTQWSMSQERGIATSVG